MAKSKKKNANQSASTKKNTNSGKNTSKKTSQVKKKNDLLVEIQKKSSTNKSGTRKPVNKPVTDTQEIRILTQEELIAQRKEKNRKKYESQQKKYHETKELKPRKVVTTIEPQIEVPKPTIEREEIIQRKRVRVKKEVVVDDTVKTEVLVKEEELVKKEKTDDFKTLEQQKQEERKEKRKTNLKTPGFTQTLTNLKKLSVTTFNTVREKTNDIHIPIGKTSADVIRRSRRLINEAVIYAIMLTIVNIIVIICFDDFNFLRLFDVKALNVVVTILISLIFNFFVAFMVDYFVTNVWLVKKRNKKDGDSIANNRTIKGEYKEDITNKEGE